jgi:hypothetical protein
MRRLEKNKSWPVSRVLSWTVIPLRQPSLTASSNLPEPSAGHTYGFLFGLAPSGVYHATDCYQPRGALLPHPFTLTGACALRRSTLCCTFRRLTPPRHYLALCPMEPGLSSLSQAIRRLPSQLLKRRLSVFEQHSKLRLTAHHSGAQKAPNRCAFTKIKPPYSRPMAV